MDKAEAKKILVVDDEADFSSTMEYWLKSKGYEVQTAGDGFKALELAKTFNPNLILLDVNMPGIDGLETLRRLREFNKDVPVVIISAYIESGKLNVVSDYQIAGVFYKDKDFEEGILLLESILRTHKKLKQ